MQGSRATGRRLGGIARQILDGASPDAHSHREPAAGTDVRLAPAAALEDRHLQPAAGWDVRFRTPTIWEEYQLVHRRHAGRGAGAGRAHHRPAHPADAASPRGTDDTHPRGVAANEPRTNPPDAPDASSTRRSRRGRASPRTCTTTYASSSSSCRWGSARSRARPDSSRTGRRRRPWRRSRPTPRKCSRGFGGCPTICIPPRCGSSDSRRPCGRTRRNGEASRCGDCVQGRSCSAHGPQGHRGVLLPDRPGGAAERDRARRARAACPCRWRASGSTSNSS